MRLLGGTTHTATMRDTAIPNESEQQLSSAAHHLTRGFLWLLGLSAVIWGLFTLPLFWQQASPISVAVKLLQGDSFKVQSLVDEAQQADHVAKFRFCNPAALHSIFVLRLFLLNQSIASADHVLVNSSYGPAYSAARNAVACAPADSFVWLALFWLEAGKHGLDDRNAGFLRLSYALSPNEAWIALWRTQLAMLLFDRLSPDLSSAAGEEFVKLVNSGWFHRETAVMFKNASPKAQNDILEQLKTINLSARQAFSRAIREQGLDVQVPGVEKPARPWH
jgi:hypothetical protein